MRANKTVQLAATLKTGAERRQPFQASSHAYKQTSNRKYDESPLVSYKRVAELQNDMPSSCSCRRASYPYTTQLLDFIINLLFIIAVAIDRTHLCSPVTFSATGKLARQQSEGTWHLEQRNKVKDKYYQVCDGQLLWSELALGRPNAARSLRGTLHPAGMCLPCSNAFKKFVNLTSSQ